MYMYMQARIEALRKGDFSLDLRYSDGVTPLAPAAVTGLAVTLKKHDFPFGVAYRCAGGGGKGGVLAV